MNFMKIGLVFIVGLLIAPATADAEPNRFVLIGTDRDGTVFLDTESIKPGVNSHTFEATTLSVDRSGFATIIVNYDCAARATKSEGLVVFFGRGAEFPAASVNTRTTSKWEPVFPHTPDDKVLAAVCGRRDLTGASYPDEDAAIAAARAARP